jgi:UDP-N-acetylglucosamine:LPS N-acetylglucosamine transferase
VLGEWLLIGVAGALAAGGLTQQQRQSRRFQHLMRSFHFPRERPHVLILSASIGGGHNAAAAVLRQDLEALGCGVTVLDGFAFATPLVSRYFAWSYPLQLRYAPWLYDWQFSLSHRRGWTRFWRSLYSVLAADAFERLCAEFKPDIVVSTYPLVTQALGTLREQGRLTVPTVAVVTDFGVHRLWTAPGIDLHLVPSSVSAAQVEDTTGSVLVMQPLARPAFREPIDRQQARERLGLQPDEFVTLIVAGAWGIGHVEAIVQDVAVCDVHTIVVCGKNEHLARRLQRQYSGNPKVRVLGWTDALPELMAASDCLVQNAGGLTCLEAIARGLPILIYRPIAGHGVLNARTMERAHAARWIRDAGELRQVLRDAAAGRVRLTQPCVEANAVPAAHAIVSLLARPVAAERARGVVMSRGQPEQNS